MTLTNGRLVAAVIALSAACGCAGGPTITVRLNASQGPSLSVEFSATPVMVKTTNGFDRPK